MDEFRIQRKLECSGRGCTGGECQTTGVWETFEGLVVRVNREGVEDPDGDYFLLIPKANHEE